MAPAKGDSPSDKFEISPRNKLYLKISGNLSEEQVKTLRLLLNNHIGKGKIENATPHDIFNMLENDHKMGGGNLALLKDLLKSLGEAQLAKEAEDLEREESMKISPTSKRKAEEDASSTKHPKINCGGGVSDDSDSSDSGTGCSSSHDSPPMETDEFGSGEHLATSAEGAADEGAADVSTFETVGDVRKRIAHLRTKIAKLTWNPTSISKTKTEEVTKACQELEYLVKVLDEQSNGELKMDITPLDIEAQNEFQEEYGSGTLSQKIQKEVKHVMRSTGGDVVDVKPEVSVEFDPGSSESTNCGPGRCAKIKVTAKDVELADGCKLDKDSAVRHLFKYLVENSRKLRPIVKYLNDLFVQVKTISYGSIDFECLCLTPESAARLQEEYDCKRLEAEIQRVISSLALLIELGIKSISLAADLKFTDEGPVSEATGNRLYNCGITDCDEDLNDTNTCDSGSRWIGRTSTTEDRNDTVSLEMTSSSDSGHHFEPVGKETIERLRSRVAQLKVRTESDEQMNQRRPDQMKGMMEFQDTKPRDPRISQEDVSRFQSLHSKLGFKVDGLRPKSGGNSVHVSSIPLILPNDLKYNASTGRVEKVTGVRRETLQAVPEAMDLLKGIEGPVSVLAICGPGRTGKSYILSRLLGTSDAFELGHSMAPQTFGIWMGTKVLRGKDFTIVLLDTEGIGTLESSAGQDASILVMTILLSSYLIYNSQNVPYKGDLEKMQCFVKLASGITVRKGEGRDVAAFCEFFPDFLWLLRDVSTKIEDEDGKEMDPTDYLVNKVLRRKDPDAFEESISDKVGRAILTFFPSLECATLERPSGDTEVMNNIAQHTHSLNPAFNKGVENLTERLLLKSRAKQGYDKVSTVSGEALSIMAQQYVEAVNHPDSIPVLENTWQNTVELMQKKVIEEIAMEYIQQMQERNANEIQQTKPREMREAMQQEQEAMNREMMKSKDRVVEKANALQPVAPTNLQFPTVTTDSLVVTWGASSSADTYRVTYEVTGSGTEQESEASISATTDTIENLTPGTSYTVRVYGIKNGVTGEPLVGTQRTSPRTTRENVPDMAKLQEILRYITDDEQEMFRNRAAAGSGSCKEEVLKEIQEYAAESADFWKNQNVRVGIVGNVGAGKSTFINSFRGLMPTDPGAAPVGLGHTTSVVTEYPHPSRQCNIAFVDFPGVLLTKGTRQEDDFNIQQYLDRFGEKMKQCNVFLVFNSDRIQQNAVQIGMKAREMGTNVLIVRSKFDKVLADMQNDNPEYFDGKREVELMEDLRRDHIKGLKDAGWEGDVNPRDVFIISGRLKNVLEGSWDIPKFRNAMIEGLDTLQKMVVINTCRDFSKETIKKRGDVYRSRAAWVAVAATADRLPYLGGASVPGACAIAYYQYKEGFGLTDDALEELAKMTKKRPEDLKFFVASKLVPGGIQEGQGEAQVAFAAIQEAIGIDTVAAVDQVTDIVLPVIGAVVTAPLTLGVTYKVLHTMISVQEKCASDLIDYAFEESTQ